MVKLASKLTLASWLYDSQEDWSRHVL
jgi:hypothetical protein